jgi:casein kinase II subunit alpha
VPTIARITAASEDLHTVITRDCEILQKSSAVSDLDRYELVRFIGQGRFSIVFEAINVDNSTFCVIKVMKSPDASKLTKEIQILRSLGGVEGVVQLRDVFVNGHSLIGDIIDNNATISTAELVFDANPGPIIDWHAFSHQGHREGRSNCGSGGTLGPGEVRTLMRRLLRALRDCHARGVMHRDVKPENVIVNVDDLRLLLIDFGLR